MTTRKKILAGFILVFIIGLILGICGLVSTNMLTNLSDEQYNLQRSGSGVSATLNAHYIWRHGIMEAVLTGSKFSGSTDPETCSLGQWKNSAEAQSITDPELLSLLKQLDEPHSYIHNQAKVVAALIESGDLDAAKLELTENILPRTADVITALTNMESRYATLLDNKGIEVLNLGKTITTLIIVLIIISALLCLFLALIIVSSIMKPIRNMAETAKAIAAGDLDVLIDYNVNDEIGQLADAFRHLTGNTRKQVSAAESLSNGDLTVDIAQRSEKDAMNLAMSNMVNNLNSIFTEINVASEQVSSGAEQVSHGAQELATGASQQAASVEEFSATLSAMQEEVNRNADNSAQAKKANSETTARLEGSIRSMAEMLVAMKEIDESSQNITRVINVIDDIAFQTNILALNAAVEAARAGQHGKGFAVVADEVRNLAAKSADAAKETSALIEGSSVRVRAGNEIVAKTNADLEAAVANAHESTRLIEQVASGSLEQARSIQEINQGIEQISSVVQANSATAEQSAAAAEEMSAQSIMMNNTVARFKLKNSTHNNTGSTNHSGSTANTNLPLKSYETERCVFSEKRVLSDS